MRSPPPVPPRPWRQPAAVAISLALALAGCRAHSAAPAATRDAAGRTACGASTVYVVAAPSLVVTSGRYPYLMLDAAVARAAGAAPTFVAGFMASLDRSEGSAEDAVRRSATTAATLLAAFGPVLPDAVHTAVVTATFGQPGTWGIGLPVRLEREGGRWRAVAADAALPVLVPPLPAQVDRRVAEEDAAVLAARTFLERIDRGDLDGAWALASAALKASTSRAAFERDLSDGAARQPAPRTECFRRYPAREAGLALGDVLEVCFAAARGAERVEVRLDDDQAWRVVRVARMTGGDLAAGDAPEPLAGARRPDPAGAPEVAP